ncbi:putative G-protein coupled receptor 139 [Babylonia areolata]|uniref:putative G-protein coupled receptor 139 n=1 Tax=Babylonia areolata TaxID=304850 RepID=UPI003FD3B322
MGNVATIIVMGRLRDDHSSSSHRAILIALAASDLSLLYIIVFPSWVTTFLVDWRHVYPVLCKVHWWLVYAVNTLCAWLVTAVTVQRTLAVTWPHRVRALCTWRRTWTMVACVAFLALAVHCHFLYGMGVSAGWCYFEDYAFHFYVTVWHWVDLLISSLLPTVCLLVCDVILSLTLFKASAMTSRTARAASNENTTHAENSRRKAASRTTATILAVSFTFVFLTLPVCVYYLAYGDGSDITNVALWGLLETVAMMMWYFNSAVNFLLYCLTGTKFRTEFVRLFRCKATAHVAASGSKENTIN